MRRKTGIGFLVFILAAAFGARLAGGQMTSKTVDGVLVIKNGKQPVPAAKVVLEPLFAIGGADSPEKEFSSIGAVAVREDGAIYVLDTKECRVKAFDAAGRLLFSFGKKGQGPGEWSLPNGLLITPSKEILVEDALNRRLSFHALDGTFLRHQSTAEEMGLTGLLVEPGGRMVGRAMTFAGGKIGFEINILDKDLKVLKTLTKIEMAALGQMKMDPLSSMPGLIVALDAKGDLFLGSAKGYAIRVFDFDGRPIRTIERDFDPIPVRKEDQDEILKLLAAMPSTGGFSVKEMIVFPDVFPAYSNFIVNPDGRLLVRTYEKGKKPKEYFHDVFDAAGRFVAHAPFALDFLAWRGDKIYALEENEDGFKVLKCFRARFEK